MRGSHSGLHLFLLLWLKLKTQYLSDEHFFIQYIFVLLIENDDFFRVVRIALNSFCILRRRNERS